MATTTANQQLPVPVSGDDPDVAGDMTTLATAIEKKLVMVFTSVADRSARVPAPTSGMFAVMTDTDTVVFYDGAAWKQVYPPVVPAVTNGTAVPSNATGANGDVFFKF
jgi:hypothetical protein